MGGASPPATLLLDHWDSGGGDWVGSKPEAEGSCGGGAQIWEPRSRENLGTEGVWSVRACEGQHLGQDLQEKLFPSEPLLRRGKDGRQRPQEYSHTQRCPTCPSLGLPVKLTQNPTSLNSVSFRNDRSRKGTLCSPSTVYNSNSAHVWRVSRLPGARLCLNILFHRTFVTKL